MILREDLQVGAKFVFGNDSTKPTHITAIGRDRVLCIDPSGVEISMFIKEALARLSHVPTPQPEVIWGPAQCLHWQYRIIEGGELQSLPSCDSSVGWSEVKHDPLLTPLARDLASLHSSLKALEQERDRFLKLAKEAKEWGDAEQFGTIRPCLAIFRDLAALSPYPREEQK